MWSRSTCTDALRGLMAALAIGAATGAGAQSLDVERALMPGPVIEGHAKYEQECEKCHKRFDKAAQTRLCADCHKEVAQDIQARTRLHGRLDDKTCRTCHTDHKGRGARIAVVDKEKFDHDRTGFRLKGAHRETRNQCADCHPPKKKYREAPSDCYSCHKKNDEEKGHKGSLGKKCEQCHNEVKWTEAKFDHDKTRFKLEGEHGGVACKECHREGRYKDTPRDCHSCHKTTDNEDGHKGRFGTRCEKCHSTENWRQPLFVHDRDTKYRLKGKHAQAECTACHKGQLFKESDKPSAKCLSCHRKDDEEKGHKGSLGEKCESCHGEQGWKTTSFDHDKDTKWPLEGKHKTAKCDTCHKSGLKPVPGTKKIEQLPTKCAECHRKEDKEKGHKGRFGEKCDTCHTPKDWKKPVFDHDLDTKYILRGKHREAKCADCHTGQLYVDKSPTDCYACHRKHDEEKGHKGELGKRCDDCHREGSWKVEKFDHKRSRFPLSGSHERVECKKCHENVAFRRTPRECYGCHEKDDKDKGHKGRFGTKCETCHNDRTWKSWDFDHNKTKFPLTGGHKKAECYDCHKVAVSGRATVSRLCVNCHFKDDIHNNGFGSQCEICHIPESWRKIRR